MAKSKAPAKKAAPAKVDRNKVKPMKKASAAKPAAPRKLPPLFKELKPGKMTEKKLMGMRDKKGFVSFLLTYPLGFLLGHPIDGQSEPNWDQPVDKVMEDAEKAACPSDQWVLTETDIKPYAVNPKKETVSLLISTKIEPAPKTPTVSAVLSNGPLSGTETMRVEHGPGVMTDQPKHFDPTTIDKGGLPRIKAFIAADATPTDKVVFDATLWFEQATDKEILDLARDGWGHEQSSDKIAEFMRDHDADVKKLLESVDNDSDDLSAGSSVEVDKDLALDWIGNHRSHLSDDVAKIETEATADEEEEAPTAKA